ncbi:MAG TPA: enoyl-CoA hydratase-related protein [Microbacterium sp.]|nr:enoyl-CoA hydratase-related protein [Microbacterium sp.]
MTVREWEAGVRLDIDDRGVATVTIDRPAVRNAVDQRTHDALNEVWELMEGSPEVRVVVVTGAGDRAFCAGADMSASAVGRTGLEYWAGLDPNGFGGISLRRTLLVPIVARVNGFAVGGGMEIALGADIIVAADHAKFGLTEPRVGRLALDGGIHQLVRKVPHQLAMGMLLTGRMVSAQEAYRMGLANEVVPLDELDDTVERWVGDLLASSPSSIRAMKQMVAETGHLTAREARGMRLPALIDALDSDDAREGVEAFQQKRPPQWTGR